MEIVEQWSVNIFCGGRARVGFWQLAIMAAIFSPRIAAAGDSVKVSTNYYPVVGTTEREIHRSIRLSNPWKDQERKDAETQWNIQWSFTLAPTKTGCSLQSLETKTTIAITLPQWKPGPDAAPDLIENWKRYFAGLVMHEDGHHKIALAGAAEMRKRLAVIQEGKSCDELTERLNKIGRQVTEACRVRQEQYDKETRHGATQGTTFR